MTLTGAEPSYSAAHLPDLATFDATNTFDFQGTALRTIEIDGEPWFHATDVCRCIGLSVVAGTAPLLRKLDDDQHRLVTRTLHPLHGAAFLGAAGMASAVNESGLYKLAMRCDKAQARTFQDWVERDVLPAIRKTGGYLLNEEARKTAHADSRAKPQQRSGPEPADGPS